jgi:hypothetical protein
MAARFGLDKVISPRSRRHGLGGQPVGDKRVRKPVRWRDYRDDPDNQKATAIRQAVPGQQNRYGCLLIFQGVTAAFLALLAFLHDPNFGWFLFVLILTIASVPVLAGVTLVGRRRSKHSTSK